MSMQKCFLGSVAVSLAFLTLVPTVSHLLFSSLGFNPTDDGFTLAYARRILSGQLPHRDFIMIRPPLSPILHMPVLILGGGLTYWLSRLIVWVQLACIAWLWLPVMERILHRPLGNLEKVCFALISFAVSTQSFPIIAWHTIDCLFLMSVGLALCTGKSEQCIIAGYVLLGSAYLCKQSFMFAAPLALIILGHTRFLRYWIAVLAPGAVYLGFLAATGTLSEALSQLGSQRGILAFGFLSYFRRETVLGLLIGYLSTRLETGRPKLVLPLGESKSAWVGLMMLSTAPLLLLAEGLIVGNMILSMSFGLFGLVLGRMFYFLAEPGEKRPAEVRAGTLALVLAWSASLSIGYNYPVLASGHLLVVLLACVCPTIRHRAGRLTYYGCLLVSTAMILVSFWWARMHYIYREQPATRLTERLDDVLPGGKLIRTNPNTYAFLLDLQKATRFAEEMGKTYAIIPECAGYWVGSQQANPLPIDWPEGGGSIELRNPQFVKRVIQKLEAIRATNVVILQKVECASLAVGFSPIAGGYPLVDYIRDHFEKTQESELFEIYK